MQFRHDVMQFMNPITMDPNNVPPGIVPNLNIPDQLKQFLPPITALVINDISLKVNNSPARMLVYNMMTFNNLNNETLFNLVSMAMKFFTVEYVEKPSNNINQLMLDAVKVACISFVSVTIQTNRFLIQYMNQQDVHASQEYLRALQIVENKVLEYYNTIHNRSQVNYNGGVNFNQQNNNYNNQNSFLSNGFNSGQGFVNQGNSLNVNNGSYDRFSSKVTPNTGSNFNYNHDKQLSASSDIYDRYSDRNTKSEPVVSKEPFKLPNFGFIAGNSIEDSGLTESDWISTIEQPYKTLISNKTHLKSYKKDHFGKSFTIVEVINEKDTFNMDRNAHYTGALILKSPTCSYNTHDRLNDVNNNMDGFNTAIHGVSITDLEERKIFESDNQISISDYVTKNYGMNLNIESAIQDGKALAFTSKVDGCLNIYRHYAYISEPVFMRGNMNDFMKSLNEANSLRGISAKMVSAIESLKPSHDGDTKWEDKDIFLSDINNRLTKMINEFLKYKLSLSISIDSFTDDLAELYAVLEDKGAPFVKAYHDFENEVVYEIFKPIPNEVTEQFNLEVAAEDTTWINGVVSITYIGLLSKELDFAINDNEGYLISEVTTPWLFKLAKGVFDTECYSEDNLLITKDNKVFKLFKGLIGMNVYLLAKV